MDRRAPRGVCKIGDIEGVGGVVCQRRYAELLIECWFMIIARLSK